MQAYDSLKENQIWQIVLYVRQLAGNSIDLPPKNSSEFMCYREVARWSGGVDIEREMKTESVWPVVLFGLWGNILCPMGNIYNRSLKGVLS